MPSTVCIVTLVLPLPLEHDADNNAPDLFRFKVDLTSQKPTPLEEAAKHCAATGVAVLHIQEKEKPYEVSAYETLAKQIKQAIEELGDGYEDDDDDDEDEDDFDDDAPASKKQKKASGATSAPMVMPTVRKLEAIHLAASIARHDDGSYKKTRPLQLAGNEHSLVIVWEPLSEDKE
jgi:hypothetical protein